MDSLHGWYGGNYILLVSIDFLSLVNYNYSLTEFHSLIQFLILSCSRTGFGNLTKLIVVGFSLLNFFGYAYKPKSSIGVNFECHLALASIGRLQSHSWKSVFLRTRSHASTLSVDIV